MSRSAAQNKAIAAAAVSSRPAALNQLQTIMGYIDREAEAGGLQVTTGALDASTVSELTALGYSVTHVTQEEGVPINPSYFTISWDI